AGGYMLFVIPGIVFSVWFFFAPFVFIDEDARGMDALLKSRFLVRGKWLPVCGRLLAIWLLTAVVACIPFVGQLAALFLIPLSFVYTHLVYQDLKSHQPADAVFEPTRKAKVQLVAASAFGFIMPVVLAFAFMGSMMTMPFAMLKAAVSKNTPLNPAAHSGLVTTRVTLSPRTTASDVGKDIQTLEDKAMDWTKRSQAASRLGHSKDPRVVAHLLRAVSGDKHWMVRRNAVKALETLKVRRAVPSLCKTLASDDNVFVRAGAAKALGALGDPRAIEPLKKALHDEGVVTTFKDGKAEEVKEVAVAARKALDRLKSSQLQSHQQSDGGKQAVKSSQPASNHHPAGVSKKAEQPDRSTASTAIETATGISGEESKKYRQVIEACTKALRVQPKDGLVYHNRAIAHFRLGNYQDALKDLTRAIALNPKDASAYYNRAIVYGKLGDPKHAIEDGIKAIELNPKDARAYANRGIDYLSIGNAHQALKDFNKALRLNARDADVYYARGVAYYRLGMTDKAAKDFKNAAKRGSQMARNYLKAQQAQAAAPAHSHPGDMAKQGG
ncbi:MAG: tetratricopeptide repeat protein, partial [Deltaproteobacteria bacterium]|nr:tetratricopeptide repeat protein [Deltaproteobacteria bacterium]